MSRSKPHFYSQDFSELKRRGTRVVPEDCGAARINPDRFIACSRTSLKLVYTVGRAGLWPGGGIRIKMPAFGMDRWELGKVSAGTSRPDTAAEVSLERKIYDIATPPIF